MGTTKVVEYEIREKESGMPVAWSDDLSGGLHYLLVYNQDFPHEMFKVTKEYELWEPPKG